MRAASLLVLPRRLPLATWCAALTVSLAILAPARAAEDAVVAFGRLPVRFNGRIGTMETAAKALLWRISGREVTYDSQGQERSAVAWLLDEFVAEGKETGDALILVENDKLRTSLGLPVRKSGDEPQHDRHTFTELVQHYEKLTEIAKMSADEPELVEAVYEVIDALESHAELRETVTPLTPVNREELQAALAKVQEIENASMPDFVLGNQQGQGWMSWPRAVLLDIAAAGSGNPRITSYVHLDAIFSARKKGDEAFAKAIADYQEFLKERAPQGELDFKLPATWREVGVTSIPQALYYYDTLANGGPGAVCRWDGADGSGMAQVIYFPRKTASVERIANNWRIQSGLAPLTDAELHKVLKPVRVGTHDGFTLDLVTSDRLRGEPMRIVATILRRENDALVIQASGSPAAFEAERENLAAFVAGLKWQGNAADSELWFALNGADQQLDFSGRSIWIANVKIGDDLWHFTVKGRGPIAAATRKSALEFLEKFDAAAFLPDGDPQSFTPPEGWITSLTSQTPVGFEIAEQDNEPRILEGLPLNGYAAKSELPLLNDCRTSLGLKPWTAKEAAKAIAVEQVGDRTVRIVEITTPQGPPPAAPPAPQQ